MQLTESLDPQTRERVEAGFVQARERPVTLRANTLKASAADVRAACEKAGLLVLTAKTRLRLLPPLILTADDVDDALATLRSVLEKCV